MPTKETKEQKEKRLKAVRRTLSERSRQRQYSTRLLDNFHISKRSLGSVNYKLSKDVISENLAVFNSKYKDPDSAFQKNLAYLQSSLSEEEYKARPEYKLSLIIEELENNGVNEFSKYASIDEMYATEVVGGLNHKAFTYNDIRSRETEHLKKAMSSFELIDKRIKDELLMTEYASTEAFQQFYADLQDLTGETKRIVSGGLRVPEEDYDDENERDIYHVKLTKDVKHVDPVTNEVTVTKEIAEPVLHQILKHGRNEGSTDPDDYYNVEYRSAADEPLFSHDPCPEDIQQGRLGDCYLIATISSIADSNPDYIRNCMKDNGDGTVTVRLYDDDGAEVYTTVNKTVPMYEKTKGNWTPAYARGALWVTMLEKAYIQSGVRLNVSASFAANKTVGRDNVTGKNVDRNSYDEIVGGRTEEASRHFLGKDYDAEGTRNVWSMDIPTYGQGVSPKGAYAAEELAFFDRVRDAYDKGCMLTAGTPEIQNRSDQSYKECKGLPAKHAYTVIGTRKDESTGKMYIRVRNPHATAGRSYDQKGRPILDNNPEIPGESDVELRDFIGSFNVCVAAKYEASYAEKVESKLAGDDRKMYGDAVEQACKEIISTDHLFLWSNSETFKSLKTAAIALQAEFKKEDPTHKGMDDKLQDFFKAAKAYREDRDTRDQKDSKNERNRSMVRYRLSEAIGHFEEIYNANNQKGADLQYVDFDQCKELALDLEPEKGYGNMSRAKSAAIKGLVKGNGITDTEAKDRITAVEQSGLEKIEKGLKGNSVKELMQGLCQVIASRSVKAHENEMRPQDIERALSPESIDRVQGHFGKKLESALRSIDKNEFLSIMKSENIGKEMADRVSVSLNNEKKAAEVQKAVDKSAAPKLP